MNVRRASSLLAAGGLLILAAGCSPQGRAIDPAGGTREAWTTALPELERGALDRPDDSALLGRLALAYAMAERWDEAAAQAARAREINPDDGAACYAIALGHERAGEWTEAQAIYARRASLSPLSRDLERVMRARHEIAARETLHAQLRADLAAARERAPATEPNALVVRAFQPASPARADSVLAVGITHFFTHAFAEIETLTVIDETRSRLLEEEIALASSQALDPETRLVARTIGAGLALAGRSGVALPDSDRVVLFYQLDDLYLDPASDAWRGTREPARLESPTRYILTDVSREVVRIAEERMGLTLGPEVYARLAHPPTQAFDAFMAYAEGLLHEGRQEYGAAFERYREAARLDPGFAWAGDAAERVAGAGERGEAVPPGDPPAGGGGDDLEEQAAEMAGAGVDERPAGRGEAPSAVVPVESGRVRIVIRPR